MGHKKIVKFEDGRTLRYEVFDDEPDYVRMLLWFFFKMFFIGGFLKEALRQWEKGQHSTSIFFFCFTLLITYLCFRRPLNKLFGCLFDASLVTFEMASNLYRLIATFCKNLIKRYQSTQKS